MLFLFLATFSLFLSEMSSAVAIPGSIISLKIYFGEKLVESLCMQLRMCFVMRYDMVHLLIQALS